MKPYSLSVSGYPGPSSPRECAERIIRFVKFNPCFILALAVLSSVAYVNESEPLEHNFDALRPVEVTGWISSSISLHATFAYFEVTPLRLKQAAQTFSISGKLGIFLAKSSHVATDPSWPSLRFGELIEFTSYLNQPTFYAAPGVLDSREFAKLRGVPYRVNLKSALQIERIGQHTSLFVALQMPLKDYLNRFEEYCVKTLKPATARFVLSSFLGRSDRLRPAEREQVRELGVQHLFVVSGFHIAVVFAALHVLLRNWGLPGRCVTILSAWAYISAVGFTIPATRAGVIATVYYIALTLGVSTRSLNTLGLSALVVLLVSREAVFLASFQFSYACILSIILVSYPIIRYFEACRRGLEMRTSAHVLTPKSYENVLRRRVRYLTESLTAFSPFDLFPILRFLTPSVFYSISLLTTSISIQLILLPLVLHHSNRWSSLQPLSNLLLVPLFSLILPAAFALLLLFWTPFAFVPAFFLDLSTKLVETLINGFDATNRLFYVAQPSEPELLGFYGVSVVLYLCLPRNTKSVVLVLPVFLLLLLTRTPAGITGSLQLTMLDVGQGESIHIRYPDGSDGLVDTGGSKLDLRQSLVSERVVARYLWNQRARRLRFLLITHPETDHKGGYSFLASAFPVEQLFFFEPHRDYDGRRERLALGDSFQHSGVWHEVIHPPHGLTSDDRNALSIVILLRYGYFSVLLTGDIGASEEKTILSHLPKVTVLKIPHHGSRFSTSQELLSTTAPQVAMISAGRRNPFGHPSPDLLERIRKNGALAASTSTLGSLRILTDGFKFELQHYSMRRKEFVTLSRGIAHRNSGTHPQGQGSSHEPPIRDHRKALTLK